jgi:hypothetical protein
MLRWDWCGFRKKRIRSSYVELVFLHPVAYMGHVVHSGTSGSRNVNELFLPVRDQYGFHKKCAGTRYAELVFCIE